MSRKIYLVVIDHGEDDAYRDSTMELEGCLENYYDSVTVEEVVER